MENKDIQGGQSYLDEMKHSVKEQLGSMRFSTTATVFFILILNYSCISLLNLNTKEFFYYT